MLDLPYEFYRGPRRRESQCPFPQPQPGQIPVLQDDETTLADSNAILVYLCKRYALNPSWLPEDAATSATVQRSLSMAAELKHGPAALRAHTLWGAPCDTENAMSLPHRLQSFMDSHL
jgi:glutathione S-transferase